MDSNIATVATEAGRETPILLINIIRGVPKPIVLGVAILAAGAGLLTGLLARDVYARRLEDENISLLDRLRKLEMKIKQEGGAHAA